MRIGRNYGDKMAERKLRKKGAVPPTEARIKRGEAQAKRYKREHPKEECYWSRDRKPSAELTLEELIDAAEE